MRITIVGGPFLPFPSAGCGAVERIWDDLAQCFAERGHVVTVLCRADEQQSSNDIGFGVKYIRRTHWNRGRFIYLDLLKDALYAARMLMLLPKADILVTNTFWLPVLAHLRPSSGKVVVHVARGPRGQMGLYKGVARVHAVSSYIRDKIVEQCPGLASKTKVIPNPIDPAIFSPVAGSERDRGSIVTILYAGRIHPEKGLHLLVESFADVCRQAADVRLRIIGPWRVDQGGGGKPYLDGLKRTARGLPVEFVEPVYDMNILAGELRAADFFCYPSLAEQGEAFGLAPLEAMGVGLVPIVSDLKVFRDFIEPGKTGYVFDHRSPDAPKNLADVMLDAIRNTEKKEQMGAMAANQARNFGYKNIAAMYLDDFQEICAKDTTGETNLNHER